MAECWTLVLSKSHARWWQFNWTL